MRLLTAFLILFFAVSMSFGQTQYEKGYIIDKNNERKECFIKNKDWKDNPTEISYRLKQSGASIKGDFSTIKEFAIGNNFKFVSANVKVDLLNKPTVGTQSELDPVWTKQNLFLEVLLEGKATLYGYRIGKVERFFYSVNDSIIYPLTYKQIHKASTLIKNNDFRQELWDKVRLPKTAWETMKTVDYTEVELKDYFKAYNANFEVPVTETKPVEKKTYLNLKVTPGINFSSAKMTVIESSDNIGLTFDNKAGFRLGVEAEVIIPFNGYRWGILFEPNYQSYKSEVAYGTQPTTLDYKSVEFPLGLRYYMNVSDNAKVFLNGFFVPGIAIMDSKIEYYSLGPQDKVMKIEPASNLALGGGILFNKFSLEARYYTSKDFTKSASSESDKYNRFSIVLGYKFMEKRIK